MMNMEAITEDGIVNKSFQAEPVDILTHNSAPEPVKQIKPFSGFGNQHQQPAALVVKDACKQYSTKKGATPVLKNFNMTVEQGTIYSLLGSSGCGKTTILACCVGLRQLDSGDITIYGARPGTPESGVPGKRVGYMPQEIALYGEFSITEILQYFGRIYGMSSAEVKENTEFLITFLNLPPGHRRIMTLSGGQQRRVSFAVALVHNPELLILDEPTVGVDPLLRQSIWSHLCKLVSSGRTTVIITTHYIEEARDSDRIGLMRNGRLLAEESPQTLLELHNTHLLEDIVLKLCLRDTSESTADTDAVAANIIEDTTFTEAQDYLEHQTRGNTPEAVVVQRYTRRQSSVANLRNSKLQKRPSLSDVLHRPSMVQKTNIRQKEAFKELSWRLYALSVKNVLVLLRNITFLFFILVVPATQVVLICLAIGSDPKGIKFGLINNDGNGYEDCDRGSGCMLQDNFTGSLSCRFLDTMNNDSIKIIPYDTKEDALRDIKETKLWGLLMFPENFTSNMKDRALFGAHAEIETILGSRISFQLDMSNKQVGLQMKKLILETFQRFMLNIATECKIDPAAMDIPIHFESPVYGNDDTSFTEFIAPGVLLGILFFFPLCASGVSFISEKKSGALDRCMVAGVSTVEVMMAYSVTQLALLILQSGLAFGIMVLVFNIQVQGSLALALVMSILIGVAGISVGFLLATICTDELEAVMLAMGCFFPNFILSGLFWPIEGMPYFLQYISYILPCTLAGETMRSIVSRGVEFTHPAVWPGYISTFVWIIIYWICTITIHKFSKKK